MAFNIGALGNGVGKIYRKRNSSSGNLDTLPNTPDVVAALLAEAIRQRQLPLVKYLEGGYSPLPYQSGTNLKGNQYYLNADAAAPDNSISGAVEITWDMIPTNGNLFEGATINGSDEIEIQRKSPFTLIALSPASGTSDTLNKIVNPGTDPRSFLPGDVVVLTPLNGATMSFIINDAAVSSGNMNLGNAQSVYLSGYNCLVLIKDSTGWREMSRTTDVGLESIENDVGTGGTWNILDNSLAAGKFARTKFAAVLIDASGSPTLTTDYTVQGEAIISQRSIAQFAFVTQKGDITLNGKQMTVFGVDIPRELALAGNYVVFAYFDDTIDDYRGFLVVREVSPDWEDFTSLATINATNVSAEDVAVKRKYGSEADDGGELWFGGTITLNAAVTHGTGKPLASSINSRYRPNSYTQRVQCEVTTPVNPVAISAKYCTIEVTTAGAMNVYAHSGENLASGDIINLTPLRYISA